MVSQAKFPWVKLIAPAVGAVCGQIMVMVIDSESAVPRLLVPMFALIAFGLDRLLSSKPGSSPPLDSGLGQAGPPSESGWYQAGRPVGQPPEQEVGPIPPPPPAWQSWLKSVAALWDRFVVAMVGPSRRLDENAKNVLVGSGFLFVIVVVGAVYFFQNPNDFSTFGQNSKSKESANLEPVSEGASQEVQNPDPPTKQSVLKPDRFIENDIKYPENGKMYRFTNMLPLGAEAGVMYRYGQFYNLRKTVESSEVRDEWLKCSMKAVHDSDSWQACQYSMEEEVLPSGYWRVVYYPKIDQTWLEIVKRGFDDDGKHAEWITILKVARGKRANLNME